MMTRRLSIIVLLAGVSASTAFQPNLIIRRQSAPGVEVKRQGSLPPKPWGSSLQLEAHRQPKEDPIARRLEKRENSVGSAISYYSTLVFAAATLFFSFIQPDMIPIARADDLTTTTLQTSLMNANQKENIVLEETWNLMDKYFIDRTFNGLVGLLFFSPTCGNKFSVLRL
jgi:hypothetical protein